MMKNKMLLLAGIMLAIAAVFAVAGRLEIAANPESLKDLVPADMAWVAISSALVMLMTPALGFFYGGLVRQKNLVSMLVQCMSIFAVASAVWTLWGYSLAFGPSIGGFVGNLKYFLLRGVGAAPDKAYAPTIPALGFYFFQMKFAAITPALIIGAFAGRVRFKSLLLFIVLWATFVYAPVSHWVWGNGGWLKNMGVLDFAGGIVVHLLAGVSALAAAFVVGRRATDERAVPCNVPFVILGVALLWFGWFGFNAGSALAMNGIAVNALATTNISAAFAMLSWMAADWYLTGKPTGTGAATGAVCGLGAITPAAGFVNVPCAIVIGLLAGLVCNFIVMMMNRTRLDDTLDVFACHGCGGALGSLLTGVFASKLINPGGNDGLLFGNPKQLGLQTLAVVVCAVWAFVMTVVLLKIVDKVMGLRVTPEEEDMGLDIIEHGEYAFWVD